MLAFNQILVPYCGTITRDKLEVKGVTLDSWVFHPGFV